MTLSPLLIRVDGSPEIGSGHVMRCLTLGEEWLARGGEVHVCSVVLSTLLAERLISAGFSVHELSVHSEIEELRALRESIGARWLVLDSYKFDENYFTAVAGEGHGILAFDDYGHSTAYPVDLILNQNGGSAETYAAKMPSTVILQDAQFALVRREIRECRERVSTTQPQRTKVLVMMGGADPQNVTHMVLAALKTNDDLEITAVVGPANLNFESLSQAFENCASIHLAINPTNLPELMIDADVCVSASGSSVYELLYLGTPSVFVRTADNQTCVEETVKAHDAGVVLGDYQTLSADRITDAVVSLAVDKARIKRLSKKAKAVVDGRGVSRIVDTMIQRIVRIREATSNDAQLLWNWANDRGVREHAFNQNPIEWDEHLHWFNAGLENESRHHFVGVDAAARPIGQVRFDQFDQYWEIDISLPADRRERRNGAKLLGLGIDRMSDLFRDASFRATVLAENEPSARLFLKAGFLETGTIRVHGRKARAFELDAMGTNHLDPPALMERGVS